MSDNEVSTPPGVFDAWRAIQVGRRLGRSGTFRGGPWPREQRSMAQSPVLGGGKTAGSAHQPLDLADGQAGEADRANSLYFP
jgi:hypothetical protein